MIRSTTRKSRPANRFRPRVTTLEGRLMLSADVLTYHNDNGRTGLNANETILTPQNVNANTFGLVGFNAVDGKVDAEPLYVSNVSIPGQGTHNVLYVATEHDSVYAFDADTGATLWQASMLGPGEVPSDPVFGSQVTPEIGVTSTPVIDPSTGTMYVVAMSRLGPVNTGTYIQRIHALDITTGADEITPQSIDSSITFPGQGPGGDGTNVIFDPKQYKERDALLLVNGVIYTSWASHSDHPPYTGWVIAFNANDLSLNSVLNIDPNGIPTSTFTGSSGNAFWNSGGGPAADAEGNIYNISGNGPFDENLDANGFPVSGDYGDSFLKFSNDGGLTVADYFTPYNQQQLADHDTDTGSSGIMVLPDMLDSNGNTVHLAIGSGKDANIYLLNRDNMGKFNVGDNSNIYQEVPGAVGGGGEYASPAYFNGQVYFGGNGTTLRAFQFNDAVLQPTPTSQSSNSFVYPGATPSISANGTANGIVWAVENTNPAVLYAYDANDLSHELYDSNQAPGGRDQFGAGNKFITPMIADGKVFVATTNGVAVFGLLPSTAPPTVVTPAGSSSDPVTGTTTDLSVLGADSNYDESTLTYTWVATAVPPGAPAPTFSDNGTNSAKDTTVTFSQAGTYTFEVTIENPSYLTTTSDVTFTVDQTPTGIIVSPASVTVANGQSQPFSATAVDQFGNALSDQPDFTWSVDLNGIGGTVDATGLYTAPVSGTGSDTVWASSGSVSGAASVSVTACGWWASGAHDYDGHTRRDHLVNQASDPADDLRPLLGDRLEGLEWTRLAEADRLSEWYQRT